MSSGYGVDPVLDANGNPTKGTTAQDIRRISGALYTPGLLLGARVTTSTSNLNLTVSPGVVVIPTGSDENVLGIVNAKTLTASPPPSTGTRTDTVYAQQLFPAIDGDNETFVGITSGALPDRAIALQKYTVTAGNTTTSKFTAIQDLTFSVPKNQAGGILYQYKNMYNAVYSNELTRAGYFTTTFSSDRKIRLSVSAVLSALGAVGFDNSKYVEWYYLPNIDGADLLKWTTPGLHQAKATYYFEGVWDVPAGTHTFSFARGREAGPGSAVGWYGTDELGHGRDGMVFTVEDVGPVA